ncbi:hypothetical protein BD626DRAFT_629969 [Schizophyllum amplum]|uniref:HNH nuclease domain-containing protein n=1 Tax=Schizophyllum amplum TaxID=97359 RepID=A0A550CF52_9AGAR|nr:hypothetical protein BD626DRAFT_629969 [Auriculariopsis ampla]
MSAIPSAHISTCKIMENCPIIRHRIVSLDEGRYRRQIEHFEYYWGLQKGDLSLNSPLNHIELRSDMKEKLDDLGWVLMPTQGTLKLMQEISEHNQTADLQSRRNALKELSDEEHEYDIVPLYVLKQGRPTLYVDNGKSVRGFRAPYRGFPRIRSRAHPFFVVFMANEILSCAAGVIYSEKKARMLLRSVDDIIFCWTKEPPTAFLVGPDVWIQHRHPLSDDGHAARSALRDSRKGNTAVHRVRKTTRAPCRQLKSSAGASPYARCDMRPTRLRGSVLPRAGLESGAETSAGYALSNLREWLDAVARQANTERSVGGPVSLDSETAQDEELARYRQETVRDADDALHPQTTVNGGGPVLGEGVDPSRYSSNNWALRTYKTCLWADDPWVHVKHRYQ